MQPHACQSLLMPMCQPKAVAVVRPLQLLVTIAVLIAAAAQAQRTVTSAPPVPVNVTNFCRAQSDSYLARAVSQGAFGKLVHNREMTLLDKQTAPRTSRDTLYSAGVFDLEAASLTITLPNTGKRFMSLEVISEDHYIIDVAYAPGRYTYTKSNVGTRYVFLAIRTQADADNPQDVKAANALQDAIKIEQASAGSFEVPNWDAKSMGEARDSLVVLASLGTGSTIMFGRKSEVDPVGHLIGTAIGWGGNPPSAAIFDDVFPKQNDGTTVYTLTVTNVPVDGFWSVSVYNAKGYFETNALGHYTVNSITAKPSFDGSTTVQFGGCDRSTLNCLPIMPGWNYTVRMYRPRQAAVNGSWRFPGAVPLKSTTHAF